MSYVICYIRRPIRSSFTIFGELNVKVLQSKNKKKICIVVQSLSEGGSQRSTALLSKTLALLGHDIHLVSVLNKIEFDFAGTLFNLGELKEKNDTFFGRLNRLLIFRKFLKEHNFDYIIDNRARVQAYREIIITKLLYRSKGVYVIRNYDELTFTKHAWLNRYLYKNETMVAVSDGIREKFKKKYALNKITTINNTVDIDSLGVMANQTLSDIASLGKYIILYGRLDDEYKNLKLLLDAFRESRLPEKSVKLLIVGDGPDKEIIIEYSNSLGLSEDVVFYPYNNNPFVYVKHAAFTLVTSRFEGFPRVILESLAIGTPVISVDCPTGPREIIDHGKNGLLIENFNPKALAEAMDSFIFDMKLYDFCKSHAQTSVEKFSMKHIAQKWEEVLK